MLKLKFLLAIALLTLGSWWCKEVFQRFPSDLRAFKDSPNGVERLGLGAIWGATVFVIGGIIWFVCAMLGRLYELITSFPQV
jgi:hypothetical protein